MEKGGEKNHGRYKSTAELEREHLPRERQNKFEIGCK